MTKNPPRDGVAEVRGQIDRLETALFDAACPDVTARRVQCADAVASLRQIHEHLENLDLVNVVAWGEGRPGGAEVDGLLTVLWKRWLALADHVAMAASQLGDTDSPVAGVGEVRRLAVEVKAFLNPSYVLAGKMLEFRDEAIAEYARGETLEGLVD